MNEGVVWKIKKLFTHPSELFQATNKEHGIFYAFIWLLAFGIINIILNLTALFVTFITDLTTAINALSIGDLAFQYGAMVLIVLIAVPILHLSIKIFKGKSDISTTFKIVAYSLTPYLLLSFVWFIGQYFVLYTAFLIMFGIWQLHKIEPLYAALSFLIPLAIAYMLWSYVGFRFVLQAIGL